MNVNWQASKLGPFRSWPLMLCLVAEKTMERKIKYESINFLLFWCSEIEIFNSIKLSSCRKLSWTKIIYIYICSTVSQQPNRVKYAAEAPYIMDYHLLLLLSVESFSHDRFYVVLLHLNGIYDERLNLCIFWFVV